MKIKEAKRINSGLLTIGGLADLWLIIEELTHEFIYISQIKALLEVHLILFFHLILLQIS